LKVRAKKTGRIQGVFRSKGEIFPLKRPSGGDLDELVSRGLIELLDEPENTGRSLAKRTERRKEEPKKRRRFFIPIPKFSVVIPTYNRADEITRQVSSIKDEVGRLGGKIVIVDDGSTDETAQRLGLFRGPFIHYLHFPENRGVARVRKRGNDYVPKDHIVIELDDHDILEEGAVERILWEFRDPDVHVVYTDCKLMGADGNVYQTWRKPDYEPGLYRKNCFAAGVRAYRKKLYAAVGGYRLDEFPAEDYALFLRMELYLNDRGFRRIPESLCTVKYIPGCISTARADELARNTEKFRDWARRRAWERDKEGRLNLDFGNKTETPPIRRKTDIALVMPVSDKPEMTRKCIQSILKHTKDPRFIFIADKSLSFKDELRKRGSLILTEGAFNFARAVNLGIRAAGNSDVVVLNNDIEATEGWLEKLISAGFGIAMARTGRRCCGNREAWGYGGVKETLNGLNMFCVYIPRRVIEIVGLLDERFCFYGGEDTDYSLRCMRHRIPLWITSAYVEHRPTSSFTEKDGTLKDTTVLFQKKWGLTHGEIRRHYRNSLVTVIMTGRNCARYADKAIESIINQSYKNLEIIVFDDASTDGTAEICRKYKDDRLIFIRNEKRLGGSENRNTGLRMARGEFIAFQDLDDYSAPDRIEKMLKAVDENPDVDLLYTHLRLLDDEGKPKESSWSTGDYSREKLLSNENWWIAAGTLFVRRHLFEKLGGFPEYYNAMKDTAWLLRADTFGAKMRFVDEKLYYYRIHKGNIAGSPKSKMTFKYLQERERLRERYLG